MIKSFFATKKWAVWAWGGLSVLLLSIYAQVHLSVMLNEWYGGFYDLLQKAATFELPSTGLALFYACILQFMWIVMPYVVIASITNWFTRLYSFRWREAITHDYMPKWMKVVEDVEGASQRIQEDTFRWTRLIETLGLQIVRALMTLIAFLPLLWTMSNKVSISLLTDVSGSLVWVALLTSLGGLALSWIVGIKLPGLEYNNQVAEAAFRKELVLGEDNKQTHCSDSVINSLWTAIRWNYHRLYLHYGYFDLWSISYMQCMVIVPYLIMAPGLFNSVITLGFMVQVSNAFSKVHGSFSLFIDNWTSITELRSIWKRLHEFQTNIGD